jgi:hypothetical protein
MDINAHGKGPEAPLVNLDQNFPPQLPADHVEAAGPNLKALSELVDETRGELEGLKNWIERQIGIGVELDHAALSYCTNAIRRIDDAQTILYNISGGIRTVCTKKVKP